MKKFIAALVVVAFVAVVTMPAFANDPAPAAPAADKKDEKKKDDKKKK